MRGSASRGSCWPPNRRAWRTAGDQRVELLNRNDAINLDSQLAGEQVSQLQKLREIQLEDLTSKAAFQGYVIQQQAASVAATPMVLSPAGQ